MSKLEIRSPLPGTFYRRPEPQAPLYKNDGDAVGPEDTIGLIEVMKTFHAVTAGVAGKAITFLVADADAVMAGQVVAEVEP